MAPMQSTKPRPKREPRDVTLYSITEAAERMGCWVCTLRAHPAGELPTLDIATPGAGRTKTRIRSDDLAGYIERKTRGRAS